MIPFRPVGAQRRMAQDVVVPTNGIVPVTNGSMATGFTGIPGFLETIAVLGASGAAAWISLRTAMNKREKKTIRTAAWVGGIGSALLGLLYLGTKTGVSSIATLPQVRVTT